MDYGSWPSENLRSSYLHPSSSSAAPSNAYFTDQATRAPLYGGGRSGARVDPPNTARDSLQMELQNERIHMEIRARESTQSRILEEKMRRDLELDHVIAARRHEAERLYAPQPLQPVALPGHQIYSGQESRVGERALPPAPIPRYPEIEFYERLPAPREARVGERYERLPAPHEARVGERYERLPAPREAMVGERYERLPAPREAMVGERYERLPDPREARVGERYDRFPEQHEARIIDRYERLPDSREPRFEERYERLPDSREPRVEERYERLPAPREARAGERYERLPAPREVRVEERYERLPAPREARFEERYERLPAPREARFEERYERLPAPREAWVEERYERLPDVRDARVGERYESFTAPPHEARVEERFERLPAPREARVDERHERLPGPREARVGKRYERLMAPREPRVERYESEMVPHYQEFVSVEAFQPPPRPKLKKKQPLPRETLYTEVRINSAPTLSGTKRKTEATYEADHPHPGSWRCRVCKVFTTSEKGLKEHCQGKKHMLAVEESLGGSVFAKKPFACVNPSEGKVEPITTEAKNMSTSAVKPRKVEPVNDTPEKKPKQNSDASQGKPLLWCEICKLQCNSRGMLNAHLKGKRHKAKLEELSGEGKVSDKATITPAKLKHDKKSGGVTSKSETKKNEKTEAPSNLEAKKEEKVMPAKLEVEDDNEPAAAAKPEPKKDDKPVVTAKLAPGKGKVLKKKILKKKPVRAKAGAAKDEPAATGSGGAEVEEAGKDVMDV